MGAVVAERYLGMLLFTSPSFFPFRITARCGRLTHPSVTYDSKPWIRRLPPSCDANYFGENINFIYYEFTDPTSPSIYPRFLQ